MADHRSQRSGAAQGLALSLGTAVGNGTIQHFVISPSLHDDSIESQQAIGQGKLLMSTYLSVSLGNLLEPWQ
jgi:hypothetical protein